MSTRRRFWISCRRFTGWCLKDAEKWHPGLKEEVKDKGTGEAQEKPVDFEKYVHRSIWRAVTTLTRGERYDPETPVRAITKLGKGGGGETTDTPLTERRH